MHLYIREALFLSSSFFCVLMKVLITGATGFIGSHVADLLIAKGYDVYCLTRKSSNLRWLNTSAIRTVEGSLGNEESLYTAVQNADIVFHIAGLTSARNREEFFRGNQGGTRNILNAVLRKAPSVQRFVHVSSLAAVGPASSLQHPVDEHTPYHPLTAYGESKRAAEEEVLAERDNIPVTIVRPPAVYGPRDTAILTFFQTVNKGIAPLIGFDDKHVSLVHSTDLSRGIVEAGESEHTVGKTYFISSEEFYTWRHVGNVTAQALNKSTVLPLRLPHTVVKTIAGISEFFGRFASKPPVLNYEKGVDMVQKYWICSVDNAKRDFGYRQQVSLEDGVAETVRWYAAQGWL